MSIHRYRFIRLPFGVVPAGDIFQQKVQYSKIYKMYLALKMTIFEHHVSILWFCSFRDYQGERGEKAVSVQLFLSEQLNPGVVIVDKSMNLKNYMACISREYGNITKRKSYKKR